MDPDVGAGQARCPAHIRLVSICGRQSRASPHVAGCLRTTPATQTGVAEVAGFVGASPWRLRRIETGGRVAGGRGAASGRTSPGRQPQAPRNATGCLRTTPATQTGVAGVAESLARALGGFDASRPAGRRQADTAPPAAERAAVRRGPGRQGISKACCSGRTVRTGQCALRTTRSATLPRSMCAMGPRPCVPSTMRSMLSSRA